MDEELLQLLEAARAAQEAPRQDLRPREGESREDYRARLAAADPVRQTPEGQAADDAFMAQIMAERLAAGPDLPRGPAVLDNFLRPLQQGMTFGFGDELIALGRSTLRGTDYGQELDYERAALDRAREERPVLAYGSEILGGGATGALATPALSGGLLMRIAQSAGIGAAQGGVYGFGAGEDGFADRAENAAWGGALGGVMGAAAPMVASGIQAGVNRLVNPSPRAVTAMAGGTDDMRAAANALYAQADQAAGLPRSDFTTMAQALSGQVQRQGMDDMLTPGAVRVMDNITDAATDPAATIGFREADILRRQAAIPAGNVANRTEASIGSMIVEGIDSFIDNADPQLAGVLREARDIWGRLRRTELIDVAFDRASRAASGFENGLRVEFRRILNNPRLVRGFGADEIAAMERVVSGTPMGNLLRQVGRFGVGLGGQSNAVGMSLGAIMGGAAGSAVGGPAGSALGSLGVLALGTGAKAAANATTRNAAEFARAITALGGLPYTPAIGDGARGVLARLLQGGGTGVGAQIRDVLRP